MNSEHQINGISPKKLNSGQLNDQSLDDQFIHKANKFQTMSNFVKVFFGSSIMTMPHGFALGGLFGGAVGIIVTVIINIISIILQDEAAEATDEDITSYSLLGKTAFGEFCRILIETGIIFGQSGIMISYIIFTGFQIDKLVCQYSNHTVGNNSLLFKCLFGVAITPFCWIHTLKRLSYLSALFSLGMIIGYGGIIIISFSIIKEQSINIADYTLFNPIQFPLIFGALMLILEGNGVSLNIRASMKDKRDFKFCVVLSSTFSSVFYLLIGILGYLAFGNNVNDIIFLSLPESSINSIICLVYSICIIGTFPIQGFPLYHILEEYEWYKSIPNSENYDLKFYIARAMVNAILIFIAGIVPRFSLFLDFFGSLAAGALIFIFPGILYEKVFKNVITFPEKLMTRSIIAVGVFFGGISTVSALIYLILAFFNDNLGNH